MPDRRKKDNRQPGGQRGMERRMGDRRDSHRLPLEVEVKEGNRSFEKHAGNISIGGMFFDKALSLPIGAVVQLRFSLPGAGKPLEVRGEVVETTGEDGPQQKGTRVSFTDLDLKYELLIAKYLDEHEKE